MQPLLANKSYRREQRLGEAQRAIASNKRKPYTSIVSCRFLSAIKIMSNKNIKHMEKYKFMYPTQLGNVDFCFSKDAFLWLNGTTTDNDGHVISNRTLFYDLLSRMQFSDCMSEGFRRPQQLRAGQAQYSELILQSQWRIGRKKIRNILEKMECLGLIRMEKSTVASVLTFPCLRAFG